MKNVAMVLKLNEVYFISSVCVGTKWRKGSSCLCLLTIREELKGMYMLQTCVRFSFTVTPANASLKRKKGHYIQILHLHL